MHHRILAALALVLAMSLPSHAKPNETREGVGLSHHIPRTSNMMGRSPVTSKLLAIAGRDLGRNPSGWSRLWCARQMNMWLKKAGMPGTGSNLAKSFTKWGTRVALSRARPGDIVVTGRRGGGHVGVLVAVNGKTVRLRSGNSGGRGPGRRVVAEGNYHVSRIIAVRRAS